MPKQDHRKKLVTDKHTDYLFDYFMHEGKFNEQMRPIWDEEMEKKIEGHRQPNFDTRISTDKNDKKISLSSDSKELPSISNSSDSRDVDFNSASDSITDTSDQSSVRARSPYGQKINPTNYGPQSNYGLQSNSRPNNQIAVAQPLLGEKLVNDVEKYVETKEERRARARDAYSNLQDLVERYGVKLSRHFSIDDDPDEMEAEYTMHKERRNKTNQVKFYKQILLNIVCGAEFLNEKYNPFEFKLKDWSKQVAADMDDYTEVLEELYEKYKDRGGKMAPEIRLLFMIIMSGVTFHLSQALFGSGGLDKTLQNNPNILNKMLGGLMGGGGLKGLTGGNQEPAEANAPNNNDDILAKIRKYNQTKSERTDTATDTLGTSETITETSQKVSANNEALALERERRLLAEQKAALEAQLRKQQDMYTAQMDQLRNQQQNLLQSQMNQMNQMNQMSQTNPASLQQQPAAPIHQTIQNNYPKSSNYTNSPTNLVLSDGRTKPRYHENLSTYPKATPINNIQQELSDDLDIFASEVRDSNRPTSRPKRSPIKRQTQNWDELVETIDESTSIDLDDIIETSSKKKNKTLGRTVSSTRKPRNDSATKSTSRKRRTDSASDILSTTSARKRNTNVIKL